MEDIICSKPWWCDEHGWHKSSWWIYNDGTYSLDEFSDGDHEDCDEEEVPTSQELDEAWADYGLWCLNHGEDPLNEFCINKTYAKKRVWVIDVRNWIGAKSLGLKVVGAKSGGKYYRVNEFPQYLHEYLLLGSTGNIDGVYTFDQLNELLPRVGKNKYRVELEEKIPYSESTVKRNLRKKVRRYLRMKDNVDQIPIQRLL